MKDRKKIISLMAAILGGLLAMSLFAHNAPKAKAQSSSEIKTQIKELESQQAELENQMEEIRGQYKENENEIVNIVNKKNVIDQEINLMYAKMDLVNQEISAYNVLIADKQDELDEAQAALEELTIKNRERIRAMEEEGGLSYWAVLFEANSFSDLLDRLNMVEEIASSDRRRLEEMSAAAEAVAEAQENLAAEKDALEATKKELDELQKELDAKRQEADALIQELLTRGDELEAMYGELEAMESELDKEIAQKEKEYNEAKRKEWEEYMATYTTVPPATTAPPTTGSTNNSTGTNTGSGTGSTETESGNTGSNNNSGNNNSNNNTGSGATWLRPCSYRKLTSPFGQREQPTAGASTYHEGVDLAGPEGTPIYATRAGVVTTARNSSSGGNYVTINHGDGFSSSYLHMRNYVVKRGQAVSAGQLIGYMGSTGISTGSHLHFAIYYNGRAVNPAKYVNLS